MRKKARLNFSPSFLSQVDEHQIPICTCSSSNRNNNACTDDPHTPPTIYPRIRKIYNHETALLEYVHIIMSTNKPDEGIEDEQTIGQRRRRRARVSKQRAKALISEYCTRKIPENIKISTNKRHDSSLCFSSHQSTNS